ncbi:DUF883 family protein [Parasphingopyxis marina]|uniref:DUF883 family protein n=1 Tax=Parasphingopyxis marina TaxID=2761622 RepID=A0A842HZA5_9SPHN|nr:DUF883 family protein [Parasphingopyxis marina]MBC2777763.1 DUF883 family protein [Parasphingopyxis marina]
MSVKDSAKKAGDTVRESYRATRAKAEEAYESAAARTSEYYASARERASDARRVTAETVDGNPLAALVGGLGIGMLIGALLPRTRRETELLGPYGHQITDRAREAAKAARAVGEEKIDGLGFVKDTARDTAKKVIDEAKIAASEAGSAAAKKARGDE